MPCMEGRRCLRCCRCALLQGLLLSALQVLLLLSCTQQLLLLRLSQIAPHFSLLCCIARRVIAASAGTVDGDALLLDLLLLLLLTKPRLTASCPAPLPPPQVQRVEMHCC